MVPDAIQRLQQFRESGDHTFWPDTVSVCEGMIRPGHIQGYRQLTDVYLLALAVTHGACLATFDERIPLPAVAGAEAEHLEVISR